MDIDEAYRTGYFMLYPWFSISICPLANVSPHLHGGMMVDGSDWFELSNQPPHSKEQRQLQEFGVA